MRREGSLFIITTHVRSLSVGTRTGYKLYSLNAINDKPDLLFEKGVINVFVQLSPLINRRRR